MGVKVHLENARPLQGFGKGCVIFLNTLLFVQFYGTSLVLNMGHLLLHSCFGSKKIRDFLPNHERTNWKLRHYVLLNLIEGVYKKKKGFLTTRLTPLGHPRVSLT